MIFDGDMIAETRPEGARVCRTVRLRGSLKGSQRTLEDYRTVSTSKFTDHDVADDRLAAMCQWCHLNYDASEKMRRIMARGEQRALPLTAVGKGQPT